MNKLTILVVEDEKITTDIIINSLKNEDRYIIKVATDGKKGLEAYKKIKPDIIISDLHMPNLNGIDMINEIRKNDQNVKVIILTSHDDLHYLLKAAELKLTKYLIKPFIDKELIEAVDEAVEHMQKYHVISNDIINLPEGFTWDINNLELKKDINPINLTPKEKRVLNLLFTNPNNVIEYDDIFQIVWNDFYETPNKEALKTLMSSVRKKLPNGVIENVFGLGYKASI